MNYRWQPGDAFDVRGTERSVAELLQEQSRALVDAWDAIPPGTTLDAKALSALRQDNQVALAQGLTLLQQQVTAATGLGPGFPPEIFEKVKDLPGVDVVAQTIVAALEGRLDLAEVTKASVGVLRDIVQEVTDGLEISATVADYLGGLNIVVQIVMGFITMVVEGNRLAAALRESNEDEGHGCIAPMYSAKVDQSEVAGALEMLTRPDWTNLFMPIVRPFDPELTAQAAAWALENGLPKGPQYVPGFSCCLTTQGWRVIAPVGSGVGNRVQHDWDPTFYYGDEYGYGLLPMCPELACHRALIAGTGTNPEIGKPLALTSALGVQAWRQLWAGGPATWAAAGKEIAGAWFEYLTILRYQVAGNRGGVGTWTDEYVGRGWFGDKQGGHASVCANWDGAQAYVEDMLVRLGMPAGSGNPNGIVNMGDSLPVRAWTAFDEYQTAMLERVAVAYADARTCVPSWRQRVAEAQLGLLDSAAVCNVVVAAVPDPGYRADVEAAKRARGGQCFIASSTISSDRGSRPSSIPWTSNPRPLPNFPRLPDPLQATFVGQRPARAPIVGAGSSSSSGGGGGLLMLGGLVGVGLLIWKLGGRR